MKDIVKACNEYQRERSVMVKQSHRLHIMGTIIMMSDHEFAEFAVAVCTGYEAMDEEN
jgi:hypothetical protein